MKQLKDRPTTPKTNNAYFKKVIFEKETNAVFTHAKLSNGH